MTVRSAVVRRRHAAMPTQLSYAFTLTCCRRTKPRPVISLLTITERTWLPRFTINILPRDMTMHAHNRACSASVIGVCPSLGLYLIKLLLMSCEWNRLLAHWLLRQLLSAPQIAYANDAIATMSVRRQCGERKAANSRMQPELECGPNVMAALGRNIGGAICWKWRGAKVP